MCTCIHVHPSLIDIHVSSITQWNLSIQISRGILISDVKCEQTHAAMVVCCTCYRHTGC